MSAERMVPAQGMDGRWVRDEVHASDPTRHYSFLDTHFLHRAADLEGDEWVKDGDDYIRALP